MRLVILLTALIISVTAVLCVRIWADSHRYYLVMDSKVFAFVIDRQTGKTWYLHSRGTKRLLLDPISDVAGSPPGKVVAGPPSSLQPAATDFDPNFDYLGEVKRRFPEDFKTDSTSVP